MKKLLGCIMGKTVVCFLLFILASATGAWARPTTPEEAKNVVINWLSMDGRPMEAGMSRQVKKVRSFPGPEGSPAYYVVYLNPRGLVIVPADDLVEPIIGFLPEKRFYNPSRRDPLGALVNNDVPGRVHHARGVEATSTGATKTLSSESPMAKAQRKWAWLANPSAATGAIELSLHKVSKVWVAPFVRTRWSQTSVADQACYNYYTPPFAVGSADNYPSGCVATAMSQIMRYFRRPNEGVGTTAFTIHVDDVRQSSSLRGGDGSGGPYNWSDMPYKPKTPSDAQRQAIGALLHDAGTAVNMVYTAKGSGTDTLKAAKAFTEVFKYSNAKAAYNASENLPANHRNRMVKPNLHAGYPILFGITGPVGGHAIVCDGYGAQAGTSYHHLNMGWAGNDDAWYNLPDIDASASFTSVYKCVYNIYVRGSGEIIAGRVRDQNGLPVGGASVTATRTSGGEFKRSTTTDANGFYAISKVPSAAPYEVKVQKTGYTFTAKSAKTRTSRDFTTTTGNVWPLNFVGSIP